MSIDEIARDGLVMYAYPGCERSPSDGPDSLDADEVQHACYIALRARFARAIPGGAIVAVSSISPTDQFLGSHRLAMEQSDDTLPLPHHLASDEMLHLARELKLPTFQRDGHSYYERLTLVARRGRIEKVFYPIGQPGRDAQQALTWLLLH